LLITVGGERKPSQLVEATDIALTQEIIKSLAATVAEFMI